jgi:uncharacterized membrane protein YgcG
MGSPASSSTPLTTTTPSILAVPISEKLTKSNYPLWSAQILPAIRAARLEGLLSGAEESPEEYISITNADKTVVKQPNPAYSAWVAQDQAVLGYLLSSLTRETLLHVSRCKTSAQAWSTLANLYSSQSRAHSVNKRIALATTKKNQLFVSDYYAKMCHYADELAASGTALRDDELVAYLLAGLDAEYNSVFTAVVARVDPITPSELYAQLLSFEQHMQLQEHSMSGGSLSAMAATRGRGYHGGRGSSPGRGQNRGRGRGRSYRGGFNNNSKSNGGNNSSSTSPQCQVCDKVGHTAKNCWYRYDDDAPAQRNAALASSSDVNNNWYTDSSATNHITGDFDKLTMHDNYSGNDQIHTANGSGMDITRIGNSIIPTPRRNFVLHNVLHVPSTHKNLIFVHRFTLDNDTFIEFHSYFFLIKDRKTRKVLLHGPCKGGLYPLPPSTSKFRKLVFSAIKISVDRWHNRLGHPSRDIVRRVISKNNLPCATFDSSSHHLCDACACAKAHQLPYQISSSCSSVPLELIFSDVWGPAIESFARKSYYVTFIDDYNKFTWIYLLRRKSEVSKYFLEFQALVERLFNRKILAVQSDWGGEYERLNSHFRSVGISHQVSCPHTHQQNGAAERKHRHIVEMGLALLAHACMPLKY